MGDFILAMSIILQGSAITYKQYAKIHDRLLKFFSFLQVMQDVKNNEVAMMAEKEEIKY